MSKGLELTSLLQDAQVIALQSGQTNRVRFGMAMKPEEHCKYIVIV